MISKAIEGFNWDKSFSDKSADEKDSILTKPILNIMSNLIPNEIVKPNNQTKYSVKPNNPDSIRYFGQMQDAIQKNIEFSQQKHYSKSRL